MQPATILEIFAGRAASELEREAAVRHIHKLNTELEQRVRERMACTEHCRRDGLPREVRGAAVQGRNVRWTSLLTMGESWHNNHHAYPGSARLGLEPGEWDPGWWVLSAFEKAGLVWSLRLPRDLPDRPELVTHAAHRDDAERSRVTLPGARGELAA